MKKDVLQELLLKTDSDKAGSSDSEKDIDTDTSRGHDNDSGASSGSQIHIWSRPWDTWNSGGVNSFTEGSSGLRIQKATHMNNDSTPIAVFSPLSHESDPAAGTNTSALHGA
jgi:hypothetical protein